MKCSGLGLVLGLCLGSGCQHAAPSLPPPPESAQADACPIIGRILLGPTVRHPSSSFCRDRVIGPDVNLAQENGNVWVGGIGGQPVRLEWADNQLSSSTLNLDIRETDQGTEISGTWLRQFVTISVTPDEVFVRVPRLRPPLLVRRAPDGTYGEGIYGQALRFEGAAGEIHPPEPQFALAMLGAF